MDQAMERPQYDWSGQPTLRHNGQALHGLNVLLLWLESVACGFFSATWMTHRQAELRRGESGVGVVYAIGFANISTGIVLVAIKCDTLVAEYR